MNMPTFNKLDIHSSLFVAENAHLCWGNTNSVKIALFYYSNNPKTFRMAATAVNLVKYPANWYSTVFVGTLCIVSGAQAAFLTTQGQANRLVLAWFDWQHRPGTSIIDKNEGNESSREMGRSLLSYSHIRCKWPSTLVSLYLISIECPCRFAPQSWMDYPHQVQMPSCKDFF